MIGGDRSGGARRRSETEAREREREHGNPDALHLTFGKPRPAVAFADRMNLRCSCRSIIGTPPIAARWMGHPGAGEKEETRLEAIKVLERKNARLDWEYDGEADALYLSFGKPRPAVAMDVGDGVIIRYDERSSEVVGLTIIGLAGRLQHGLRKSRPKRGTKRS